MKSGLTKIAALLLVTASSFLAQPPAICFRPPETVPTVATDYLPLFASSGDFNSDSNIDLVVSNIGGNSCNIFIGGGNGTFSLVSTYTCDTPRSAHVSDFNGDGKADIAILRKGGVDILSGNGSGNFALSGSLSTGLESFVLYCADLDSDGDTDMAVIDQYLKQLLLFTSDGTGGFMSWLQYPADLVAADITSGDFDGNGKVDLAVANYGSQILSVYYATTNGDFTLMKFSVPEVAFSIKSSDFNKDGLSDIALAGFNTIYVLLSTGTQSFNVPLGYPINQIQIHLAIADFNGDDFPDIACCNYQGKTAAFLAGFGDGTFSTPVYHAVNAGPLDIISSDFNHDGRTDAAVVNYNSDNVSILINDLPNITVVGPSIVCQGQSVTLLVTGVSSYLWDTSTSPVLELNPAVSGIYVVTSTSEYGCTNTVAHELKVVDCTGLGNFSLRDNSLFYPNPATDELRVSTCDGDEIILLNSAGTIVFRKIATSTEHVLVDVSIIPRGLYILELKRGGGSVQEKIIVE